MASSSTTRRETVALNLPRIMIGSSTIPDLSRVDWDKTVSVAGKQTSLTSVTALQALSNVPDDIKKLVSQYRGDVAAIEGKTSLSPSEKAERKLHVKDALQHLIALNLIAKGELPAEYFKLESRGAIQSADNMVDVTKVSVGKMEAANGIGVGGIVNADVKNAVIATATAPRAGAFAKNANGGSGNNAPMEMESMSAVPTAPTDLLVENQTNPTDVMSATPRFSAIYTDPDADDQANQYRLQVATSSSFTSPYWDSGDTAMATTTVGGRSPDITYGGSALATSTTYYWRIRFTDVSDAEGAWSTDTASGPPELYATSLFSDADLVAYYRMEGNSNDAKGSNNGTDHLMSYGTSSGEFGQGSSFSGSGYITVSDASSLDPSSAISFSAWIEPKGTPQASEVAIWKSNAGDYGGYLQWGIYTGGGTVTGIVTTANNARVVVDSGVTRASLLDTWAQVVVTYDGAHVKIYVNGDLKNSVAATGDIVPYNGGSPGYLGIGSENHLNTTQFTGYMDDVAIFSRALTLTEVGDLYTSTEAQATSTFALAPGGGPSSSTAAGLAFLVNAQNADGSWGSATTSFVATAAVLDALQAFNATGTSYRNGVSWLDSYIAENNDYLAQQLTIVANAGGATTTATTLASALDESTGGFVFDRGYHPDPATTAQALQALTAAGYADPGDNPNLTVAMALYYLTQTQRPDSGWGAFEGGASSIPATAEVVGALLPYRNQTLTGFESGSIAIGDYVDAAIGEFRNTQAASGTWGNGLLDTALAFYAMRSAGAPPTYQNAATLYLQAGQAENGSFGSGDPYLTAKVIKALGVAPLAGAVGDPVIDDIVPLASLQTGSAASIRIDVTNHGNAAITAGVLHVVVDGYVIGGVDLGAQQIVLNPSSTQQITMSLPNTRGFVGNVTFTAFVEGVNGAAYPNSRYDETLTFAADPTGLPGLPIYFVAQKNVTAGTPGMYVGWRLAKSDPNRLSYLPMWRNVGSSTWNTYATTSSDFFLGGLTENQSYEVTVGATAQNGTTTVVYYADPVTVRTSANETKYATSTIAGSVTVNGQPLQNIPLFGNSIEGTSDANGNFSIGNVRYGASAFHVDDFRYEPYVTRFVNSGNDLQNVKVYTNLRLDTQNPTVTDVALYGWPDYQVPNKLNVPIRYTVNDDIGYGSVGFVQSAKVEYYDPHDSAWHLIGTQEGLIYGTWTYNWYIPANLLGTGYELRVTVRDFSGKESTVATYGPFEITAGNGAPTFSFTAPGAGSGSQADLNYTIKWTAHDDEDNATIVLVYDTDQDPNNGGTTQLAIRYTNDFLDQYEWDTSGIANGAYYVRAIVSDNYNTGVVVTAQPAVTVFHVAPTAPTDLLAQGQTNPTNITTFTPTLSAIYHDPNSTDTAAYYRIQVATSSAFASSSPVWDSGKAQLSTPTSQGSRIANVTYAGPALATSTTYYWRIKLWDSEGHEGVWSAATATFSITTSPSGPQELYATSLFGDANLVAYYRTENNANDSKGSNNGTGYSMTYGTSSGRFGQGGNHSGSGDIVIPDAASLDPSSALTLSVWMEPKSTPQSAEVPIMKSDVGDGGGYWQWGLFTYEGPIKGIVTTANNARVIVNSGVTRASLLDTWAHVVLTYDGSYVKIYVNGDLKNSVAASGAIVPFGGGSPGNFVLGAMNSVGTTFFTGYMDDVAVFSRALTATEVGELYSGQ